MLPEGVAGLLVCDGDERAFICADELAPTERWAVRVIAAARVFPMAVVIVTMAELTDILAIAA